MDDGTPKYILIAEKIIHIWISNTPRFMQPKFFWLLYYRMLDGPCVKNC